MHMTAQKQVTYNVHAIYIPNVIVKVLGCCISCICTLFQTWLSTDQQYNLITYIKVDGKKCLGAIGMPFRQKSPQTITVTAV